MGERTRYLRKSDLAACTICMTLLAVSLGAIGETGRGRAKEAVCQANLRQWHSVFQGIVEENDGKFLSGANSTGYWWPTQLPHELQDWKRNRTWFCPIATLPMVDENGAVLPISSVSTAWGVYRNGAATYQGKTYTMPDGGIAGSYGLNGYVIPIPQTRGHTTANTYEWGVPASDGWGNLHDVPDPDRVPMFLDALRFDLWPLHTNQPVPNEFAAWAGGNHMVQCSINRHSGAVNCLFVDGSVRKVGLKELWTLKWHRSFDTAGPWTKAGGVEPTHWPKWMQPFKEY